MYDDRRRSIHREMARCARCSAWWSVPEGESGECACGGELVRVDMKEHIAQLPSAPVPPKE